MLKDKEYYKYIEKWASRPGCIATVGILQETEPHGVLERDIHSKQEAIAITLDLINSYKAWIAAYEKILEEIPNNIRSYMWNRDPNYMISLTPEEANVAREDQERLIRSSFPGRNLSTALTQMKKELTRLEYLFSYFKNL